MRKHAEVNAVILACEDDFFLRVEDDEVVHPDLRIVVGDAFALTPWPTEGSRGPVETGDAADTGAFLKRALALIELVHIKIKNAQEAPIFHLHRVLHSQRRFVPVNDPAFQHQGMRGEESAHALGRLWVAGDMDPQIVRAVDTAFRINEEHESRVRRVTVNAAKALAVVGPTAREMLDQPARFFACGLASAIECNDAILDTSRHSIVEDLAGLMRHKVTALVIRS